MALRYGPPADSSLYGFKIGNVARVLVASPDYIKRHGEPQYPNDLLNHQCLFYQLQDVLNDTWRFLDAERSYKIKPKAYCAANDGDLVRRWCVSGKGIALKSSLDIANDLLTGRVLPLMTDYKVAQGELWLICSSRQSITPTVRLLRDLFRERVAAIHAQLVAKGFIDSNVLEGDVIRK